MFYNAIKQNIDQNGFACCTDIFSSNDLDQTEAIITNLINHPKSYQSKFQREMTETSSFTTQKQIELLRPTLLAPTLKKAVIFLTCKHIAEVYFGGKAFYLFDHAIYKMPFNETITPWHQDQAYIGEKINVRSLHFWIPYQYTDEANGTMRFVSGSHFNYLPHELAFPGDNHILKSINNPTENIKSVSLQKGDLCIHTNMTLHGAGANNTGKVRKAWIIHFGEHAPWYKRWMQLKTSLC